MSTDKLQKEHPVQFKWTVFPLHPETPEEGIEYGEVFRGGRHIDIVAAQERLVTVAAEVGLPFTPRTRIFNSRKAQELGKLAEKLGLAEEYQQGVYRAYFAEGRNIGHQAELLEIARHAGVPVEDAKRALAEGSYSNDVINDWNRARLLGITGVPAFVCGNRLLVGYRPYQDLVSLISAT